MTTDRHERIDQYLDGALSDAERKQFESDLQSDPELAKLLELHRAVDNALSDRHEKAVERTLQDIRQNRLQRNWSLTLFFRQRPALAAAAAIALLIVAGWFLWNPGGTAEPNKLFTQYFESGTAELTQMSGNSEQLLVAGEQAYNGQRFHEALDLFEEFLRLQADRSDVRLMAGKAALASGEWEKAAGHFTLLEPDPAYRQEGRWQKSLALLAQGQYEACRELLRQVEGRRAEKAAELLEQLDNLR